MRAETDFKQVVVFNLVERRIHSSGTDSQRRGEGREGAYINFEIILVVAV